MSGIGLQEQITQKKVSYENILFLGTVVANNDPKKLQRVKVRVTGMYDNVSDSDLPWALPMLGLMMGNTSTCGTFGVPIVGSKVYVMVLGGDPNIPMFFSAPYVSDVKRPDMDTSYPNRYGFVDETGNKFVVDRQTGDIFLLHKSGTEFKINDTGSIFITGVENKTEDITGDVTINIGGNSDVTIQGGKTVHVVGNATITVDGNTSLTTTQTTVNSPTTINGDLTVNGNMAASGDVSDGTRSMQGDRDIYNSHKHPETGGNTQPPIQQQ